MPFHAFTTLQKYTVKHIIIVFSLTRNHYVSNNNNIHKVNKKSTRYKGCIL